MRLAALALLCGCGSIYYEFELGFMLEPGNCAVTKAAITAPDTEGRNFIRYLEAARDAECPGRDVVYIDVDQYRCIDALNQTGLLPKQCGAKTGD